MRDDRSGVQAAMLTRAVVTAMLVSMPTSVLAGPGRDAVAQESTGKPDDAALRASRERNARVQWANYPRDALRRGEQGVVGISVLIDRQGRLRECAVSQSSGSPSLDEATCDFLFDHADIQAYVAPGGGGAVRRQQGQVAWQLPPGHKPAASAVKPVVTASTQAATGRKICHVQTKTGSLIASQRICLTKADWQRQYEYAQEETREMHPRAMSGQ